MPKSARKFAELLMQALQRIATQRPSTTIQVVQDELGYTLGHNGGSKIEQWSSGRTTPERQAEIALLARELMRQAGFQSRAEVAGFLEYAGYYAYDTLAGELFPPIRLPDTPAERTGGRSIATGSTQPLSGPPGEAWAPFVAGPPVQQPRSFFGREREIKRIFDLLRRHPLQNVAIIGQRRSGKTSLLQYLRAITRTAPDGLRANQRSRWLDEPERYRWIYIDFQDVRIGRQEGLLRYLLTNLDLPVPQPCTLENFLDVAAFQIQAPVVLLLDEVGVALKRYGELDNTFWDALRSFATNDAGGNLAFVLAAHESPMELARDSGHSSPFFNIFSYTATLGPFLEAEARELIASSPIPIPEGEAGWILAQSKGWPILLQILCRECLSALEEGRADESWRSDALGQTAPFRYLLEAP